MFPPMMKESDVEELRGTAALDKMEGIVQQPADAPTRVRRPQKGINLSSYDEYQSICLSI